MVYLLRIATGRSVLAPEGPGQLTGQSQAIQSVRAASV
jgi:hypothetical protein